MVPARFHMPFEESSILSPAIFLEKEMLKISKKLNKTNIRKALQMFSPGSDGKIIWNGIEIIWEKENGNGYNVYIPVIFSSLIEFNDLRNIINLMENAFGGADPIGFIKRKNNVCVYMFFSQV